VAGALAELGYVDCTATAFRPAYLELGAARLALAEPAWVRIDGHRLLEVPSTHSLGMAARAVLSPLPAHVHVYFHDTDLLVPRRRLALRFALEMLGRRRTPIDLDNFAAEAGVSAGEVEFASLADARHPDT
jgi:hypothetical protein